MNDDDPIAPDDAFTGESQSRWPSVIGKISLAYAIIGLCCLPTMTALGVVMSSLGPKMAGAPHLKFPPLVNSINIILTVFVVVAGIMLIVGSARLLHRKRSGVTWLKAWVVYRFALLILGVVVTLVTADAQVEFQVAVEEFGVAMQEKHGGPAPVLKTREEHWNSVVRWTAGFAVLQSVYPVFLGLFLSRKNVAEEIAEWT